MLPAGDNLSFASHKPFKEPSFPQVMALSGMMASEAVGNSLPGRSPVSFFQNSPGGSLPFDSAEQPAPIRKICSVLAVPLT